MGTERLFRRYLALAAIVTFIGLSGGEARAQEQAEEDESPVLPTTAFVLSGYATVGYEYATQSDLNLNSFTASFNPIFLFQFGDRFLFEAEFEFELAGGVTETGLEYAQIDWLATDNLALVGGKFLLPFGVFGERLHPTWINKFPSSPPLYGHHVAAFGVDPLLPILSDLGVMARGVVPVGSWQLSLNGYVTQGPAGEAHDDEGEGAEELAEIGFPASTGDNNSGKMGGLRLDIALPPWFEVNGSFMNGDYDEEGVLDFTGWNLAVEGRYAGLEVRGEYIQTRQEIETLEGFPTLRRHGFYAQAAYRVGDFEPVFRWTQIFDDQLEGEVVKEGAWQAGFGLNYWFTPSIALMGGYELNREAGEELENDRFLVHFAFGF